MLARLKIVLLAAIGLFVTVEAPAQRPRAATQPVPPRGTQQVVPRGQQQPRPQQGSARGGQQQAQGPRRAPAGPAPPPAQMRMQPPQWVPLNPKDQKYIDDLLKFWETRSQKVTRYNCNFKRFEYMAVRRADGTMGRERDATTISTGQLRYIRPDKGLFATEQVFQRAKPATANKKAEYKTLPQTERQKWICSGTHIFDFDYQGKRLVKMKLPPNVQGQQIIEGPLPFFFGASAEQIKARYWVRAVRPPKGFEKTFWILAVPKTQQDAADFRKIEVVLDGKDHLPEALMLTHRDGSHTTYQFENRAYKPSQLDRLVGLFGREFFEPKTPRGWQLVEQDMAAPAPPPDLQPRAARAPRGNPAPRRR